MPAPACEPLDPAAPEPVAEAAAPSYTWRRSTPLWLRLVILVAGVIAASAGGVAAARALGAKPAEMLPLTILVSAIAGAALGLLLVVLPAWLASADRWALVRLIDALAQAERTTGFDALLEVGPGHELHDLAAAVHRALAGAHQDRLEAAALRRDMDARVARQTKLATAHLTLQSETDALTGLANRRGFDAAIGPMVESALRGGDELALLAIDLDRFKQLNDTLGHDRGDAALKAVGEILAANLRETDLAARLGGDEFVVVLYGLRAGDARRIAERLIALLRQHPAANAAPGLALGMSIGIALLRGSGAMDAGTLRKLADDALYAVKRAGRGAVCVAGDELWRRRAAA